MCMQWPELRSIQKSARIDAVNRREISPVIISLAQVHRSGSRAEGPVFAGDPSMNALRPQPALGGRTDNEARLISKLRRSNAADNFHRVDRARCDLIGERAALLIADRLIVDDE